MIGALDQRAVLWAETLVPDGGGGFSASWENFASVWLKIEPLGGSDGVGADRLEARVRHRLTLRRRTDLAAGQRAQVGPRIFRIHTVIDDQGPFVTLLAEELP